MYLKKVLYSSSKKIEAIFLGDMGITDYGVLEKYNNMVSRWNTSDYDMKKMLIETEQFNEEGQPLWKDHQFKTGIIEPHKERTRNIFGLFKEEQQTTYKLGYLHIRGLPLLEVPVPLFKKIELLANKGQSKNVEEINFNATIQTNYKIIEDSSIDFEQLINKYCSHKIVQLNNLLSVTTMNDDNNKLIVVQGDVSRISLTKKESKSNVIELLNSDLDVNITISVWVPKTIPINFGEGSINVIIIGRIGTQSVKIDEQTNNTVISIQAYSLYVPPDWRTDTVKRDKLEEVYS